MGQQRGQAHDTSDADSAGLLAGSLGACFAWRQVGAADHAFATKDTGGNKALSFQKHMKHLSIFTKQKRHCQEGILRAVSQSKILKTFYDPPWKSFQDSWGALFPILWLGCSSFGRRNDTFDCPWAEVYVVEPL